MAAERRDSFFGRRKGRRLRAGRALLVDSLLAERRIDIGTPPPEPLSGLFSVPVDDIRLEIGFGAGEHLAHRARTEPRTGFIGVEPFVNGMAAMLSTIAAEGLPNIRLFDEDAAGLIDWLPDAALGGIDLLYPDPWPKKRHFKRRFVSARNLARMARVLRPGGLFRFASDIDSYAEWTLVHALAMPEFEWTAERADDWRLPFDGWPGTRYEAKAVAAGRKPTYLAFRRR